MTARYHYLNDPQAIYRRSFELVRAATDLDRFPGDFAPVVERLVHACGMPEIAEDLAFSDDVVERGRSALVAGAPVLADCEMVVQGVIASRLPAENRILCTLNDPDVLARAAAAGTTRSAAAVDLWLPHLADGVVAIGNAPTALFRLLELLAEGAPRPAAILAFPVGFVGAAESKDALIDDHDGVPFLTLKGRRGGSALAAAAVNAIAGTPS
ncbi:MAG: precorrin-8X methylmutase [Pseudomonadota bacterium]